MERAKYGSLKHLTPQEYAKHKATVTARWRENHTDYVRQYFKNWYEQAKTSPKHLLVCKICQKTFLHHRKSAKICPLCLLKRRNNLT